MSFLTDLVSKVVSFFGGNLNKAKETAQKIRDISEMALVAAEVVSKITTFTDVDDRAVAALKRAKIKIDDYLDAILSGDLTQIIGNKSVVAIETLREIMLRHIHEGNAILFDGKQLKTVEEIMAIPDKILNAAAAPAWAVLSTTIDTVPELNEDQLRAHIAHMQVRLQTFQASDAPDKAERIAKLIKRIADEQAKLKS